MGEFVKTRRGWLRGVLVGLDQFANTIIGGDPDETISSRAAKARDRGETWGCVLCRVLGWFQKDHCDLVREADEGNDAYLPEKLS